MLINEIEDFVMSYSMISNIIRSKFVRVFILSTQLRYDSNLRMK